MIHELLTAQQERLKSLNQMLALQLHRQGLSLRQIGKRLEVDPKKAKRMVERGQGLFPEATAEELAVLTQAGFKKFGQSACLLAQMLMRRPFGQGESRN